MRAIEEKIIQTLRGWNGEGTKNLSCRDCVEVDGNTKKYYLWNNLLFWSDSENIYYFSGRGWKSSTTKSRLSCILDSFFHAGIYQKKGSWFLGWNGKKYLVDSENIFYFMGSKLYKKAAQDVEILPL